MGEKSKIEWTHHTFNPWVGCEKVSSGCKNCYAENYGKRFGIPWGPGPRKVTSDGYWRQPYRWNKAAARAGERRRVFCGSLCDVFEDRDELDIERARLFGLISETPSLIWMLLTKRPENILRMLPTAWGDGWPNVWLGTTAENQEQWDARIEVIQWPSCAKRFVSCEPLLGPIRFNDPYDEANVSVGDIDWIIVGGESGPRARPMHPDWATSIRDQCQRHHIPYFFKQFGEWRPKGLLSLNSTQWGTLDIDGNWFPQTTPWNGREGEMPSCELVMERVGKKEAGRLLFGVEYSEVPNV